MKHLVDVVAAFDSVERRAGRPQEELPATECQRRMDREEAPALLCPTDDVNAVQARQHRGEALIKDLTRLLGDTPPSGGASNREKTFMGKGESRKETRKCYNCGHTPCQGLLAAGQAQDRQAERRVGKSLQ